MNIVCCLDLCNNFQFWEKVILKILRTTYPTAQCNIPDGLTLRRLMSYIYMAHPFLMFLDHTKRRTTVGRTPLDE